jgi:hypothetical protein
MKNPFPVKKAIGKSNDHFILGEKQAIFPNIQQS